MLNIKLSCSKGFFVLNFPQIYSSRSFSFAYISFCSFVCLLSSSLIKIEKLSVHVQILEMTNSKHVFLFNILLLEQTRQPVGIFGVRLSTHCTSDLKTFICMNFTKGSFNVNNW